MSNFISFSFLLGKTSEDPTTSDYDDDGATGIVYSPQQQDEPEERDEIEKTAPPQSTPIAKKKKIVPSPGGARPKEITKKTRTKKSLDSAKKKRGPSLPASTFNKKKSPQKSASTSGSDQDRDDGEPVAQTPAEGSRGREGEIGGNLLEHIIRQVNVANQAGARTDEPTVKQVLPRKLLPTWNDGLVKVLQKAQRQLEVI